MSIEPFWTQTVERPGLLIYFDTLPTLERTSPEGQARFLMGCLNFGKFGTFIDLSDLAIEDRFRVETLLDRAYPQIEADARNFYVGGLKQTTYPNYKKSLRAQHRLGEALSREEFISYMCAQRIKGVPDPVRLLTMPLSDLAQEASQDYEVDGDD